MKIGEISLEIINFTIIDFSDQFDEESIVLSLN